MSLLHLEDQLIVHWLRATSTLVVSPIPIPWLSPTTWPEWIIRRPHIEWTANWQRTNSILSIKAHPSIHPPSDYYVSIGACSSPLPWTTCAAESVLHLIFFCGSGTHFRTNSADIPRPPSASANESQFKLPFQICRSLFSEPGRSIVQRIVENISLNWRRVDNDQSLQRHSQRIVCGQFRSLAFTFSLLAGDPAACQSLGGSFLVHYIPSDNGLIQLIRHPLRPSVSKHCEHGRQK